MAVRSVAALSGAAGVALVALSGAASADDWFKTVKFSGYVEVGGIGNSGQPNSNLNWGQLFTDRDNEIMMNQLSLIVSRDIDAKKQYDFGFKFQGMYGTDARYTHFLGELDKVTDAQYQLDIVEAWGQFHTPWLGTGGTDIKIGQYVTPLGNEVIDPRGNFFYSHDYTFNFGLPLKHTGILADTHVNSMLDVYYGVDTGVNTTFGDPGDPNDSASFLGGFGLNLLKGDLTILALTHIGKALPSEGQVVGGVPFFYNPSVGTGPVATRYYGDIVATYKWNKKLTTTYEFNYVNDATPGFGTDHGATGYGIADYWVYALTDNVSIGLRSEWWRDQNGAFVGACPGNLDFVKSEEGQANGCFNNGSPQFAVPIVAGGQPLQGTNYYDETIALNWKPEVPKAFEGMVVRPEARWDYSSNTRPFNDGTEHNQFTFGADVIVPFASQ
jgi:Putative beta-barrel porin-2, OmpL-like. bbp2